MRDNWEPAEPLALSAEQHQTQQAHQQPAVLQNSVAASTAAPASSSAQPDQHPHLRPPTTPAWGKIVVKSEPREHMEPAVHSVDHQDDKNNDSGISPGHYTSESASPQSRRSSTDASLPSPTGSNSSQDSGHLRISGYEFSPPLSQLEPQQLVSAYAEAVLADPDAQLDYARSSSHIEQPVKLKTEPIDQDDEEHEHFMAQEGHDSDETAAQTAARGKRDKPELSGVSPDPLRCPICNFSSQSRLNFSEHLATHCPATQCEPGEFTRSVMEQLSSTGSPSGESNSRSSPTPSESGPSGSQQQQPDNDESLEPGLKVPRVNSQGKVKTFRCKQCDFVAITKLDFWDHSRTHIKPEKMLTCPRCPFVTEYKHHLEYHLRNHFGSKPYKCDLCNYSCVNKSMLNSHLKSHSSVYQFRCADCSYATKYCHSLKMHLRKYCHNPAMVLNSDGTPNPLPIIDVYGTRRGPKAKPKKESSPAAGQTSPSPASPTSGLTNGSILPTMVPQPTTSAAAPMTASPFQFSPMSSGLPKFAGFGPAAANGLSLPGAPGLFPFFGGFPFGNPFAALGHGGSNPQTPDDKNVPEHKPFDYLAYARSLAGDARMPNEFPRGKFNGETTKRPSVERESSQSPTMMVTQSSEDYQQSFESSGALDLSKPESPRNKDQGEDLTMSQPPKPKGRRKGKAVRLDRRILQQDSDEEMRLEPSIESQPAAATVTTTTPAPTPSPTVTESNNIEVRPPSVSPTASTDSKSSCISKSAKCEFYCQYCEISFGIETMHSLHMGYHGYKNPFTCNMCGCECSDKVSFFLHIMRSKH